jgi:hypothetical protein
MVAMAALRGTRISYTRLLVGGGEEGGDICVNDV